MVPGRDILSSAALCPLLSLRRMNEQPYPDTCQIQHDHGRREDAHVRVVSGKRVMNLSATFEQQGVPCVIINN